MDCEKNRITFDGRKYNIEHLNRNNQQYKTEHKLAP